MQVTDAPLPRLEGRCRSRQVLGECRNSLGFHAAASADQPSSRGDPVPAGGDYPTWKLLMKVDGVRTTQIWLLDFAPESFTLSDALPFLTEVLNC